VLGGVDRASYHLPLDHGSRVGDGEPTAGLCGAAEQVPRRLIVRAQQGDLQVEVEVTWVLALICRVAGGVPQGSSRTGSSGQAGNPAEVMGAGDDEGGSSRGEGLGLCADCG
jgi:hypothetical protein